MVGSAEINERSEMQKLDLPIEQRLKYANRRGVDVLFYYMGGQLMADVYKHGSNIAPQATDGGGLVEVMVTTIEDTLERLDTVTTVIDAWLAQRSGFKVVRGKAWGE